MDNIFDFEKKSERLDTVLEKRRPLTNELLRISQQKINQGAINLQRKELQIKIQHSERREKLKNDFI